MSTYTPETLRELATLVTQLDCSDEVTGSDCRTLYAAQDALRSYADVIDRARVTDELVLSFVDTYVQGAPASYQPIHVAHVRMGLHAALAKVLGEG